MGTSMLGVFLLGVGMVLHLEKDAWSMVQRLRQATNKYAPPRPAKEGALRCKVDKEEHLKIYGGFKEGIGMKACLHGALDASKNLKLRFRAGGLDLPESKRVEEGKDKQNCPRGKAIESRTHIVAECELYQEERDVWGKCGTWTKVA